MKKNIFHKRQQSIVISITTLIATVIFGGVFAFTIGLVTPTQVFAQVGPPCCTVPPTPPPVIVPIVPVVLPITTSTPTSAPTCTLSASPASIVSGNSSSLSYTTTNATSFTVNHSVGSLSPVSSGSKSVSPTNTTTYTGTAIGTAGGTITCSTKVTVTHGGGGCTGSCGGGSTPPTITLTQLSKPHVQPLAFVYLSQIPYTGLDLGTFGTIVYWLLLILWSLVMAYVALFILAPFFFRYARVFGEKVREALNTPSHNSAALAMATPAPSTPTETVAVQTPAPTHIAPTSAQNFSPYEGFRSFAQAESPTVEDIVKGLSRSMSVPVSIPQPTEKSKDTLETGVLLEQVEQAMRLSKKVQQEKELPETVEIPTPTQTGDSNTKTASTDTRGFVAALLGGDRTTVFALLRQIARGGGSVGQLITEATCVLDDAYRARVDGTVCDPDIARLAAKYQTQVLEHIVAALTTAIDSSYSSEITGAKLALTRALSYIGA